MEAITAERRVDFIPRAAQIFAKTPEIFYA